MTKGLSDKRPNVTKGLVTKGLITNSLSDKRPNETKGLITKGLSDKRLK